MNPVKPYIDFLTPKNPNLSPDEIEWYRTIILLTGFGLLVSVYSVIKWWRLDYEPLMATSVLLLLLMLVSCVLIRLSVRVDVCAGILILGFAIHACNMSYQTGGLNSSHIFWPLAVMSFAYLFTPSKQAFVWSALMFAYVAYLMVAELSGSPLPS